MTTLRDLSYIMIKTNVVINIRNKKTGKYTIIGACKKSPQPIHLLYEFSSKARKYFTDEYEVVFMGIIDDYLDIYCVKKGG